MEHRLTLWHRSMVVLAVLFLLMFSVTGILLNHTLDLKLEERHLVWPWLLKHYDVAEVEADLVYLIEDNVISQFNEQVFVDAVPVAESLKPIIGGIYLDNITVVASDDVLILLSSEGEFIEEMDGAVGIPSHIQNIGLFHGLPVLQTRHGMWRGDVLLEQWEKISLQGVSWSERTVMPRVIKEDLARYFYGKGISAERVIIDLHNGHILGAKGLWFVDVMGISMMVLSCYGLWRWRRSKA